MKTETLGIGLQRLKVELWAKQAHLAQGGLCHPRTREEQEKYGAEDSGFWKYLDHPLNPTCLKVREVFPDVAYSFNLLQLDIT